MNVDRKKLSPSLEETIPAEVFKAEVNAWAQRIGVELTSITIRPMKHKWASCSDKGNLTFDRDLLVQSAEFRRKVIVHELLHLKFPKHNKLFSALEKAYLDGEEPDNKLR
jgi:predicted metal-dependent hydrolase